MASFRRRAPRRASWSSGCPAGPPPAARSPPGASARCWLGRRTTRAAARLSLWSLRPVSSRRSSAPPSHLTSFDRAANHHETTPASGNGALDQQHAVFRVHLVHQQVLRRHAVVAHPARHPGALEDPAGGGAAADGTRPAVDRLRAVACALAAKAVAFHRAGGSLPLRGTGHVDIAAVSEDLGGEFLTHLVFRGRLRVVQTQLRKM